MTKTSFIFVLLTALPSIANGGRQLALRTSSVSDDVQFIKNSEAFASTRSASRGGTWLARGVARRGSAARSSGPPSGGTPLRPGAAPNKADQSEEEAEATEATAIPEKAVSEVQAESPGEVLAQEAAAAPVAFVADLFNTSPPERVAARSGTADAKALSLAVAAASGSSDALSLAQASAQRISSSGGANTTAAASGASSVAHSVMQAATVAGNWIVSASLEGADTEAMMLSSLMGSPKEGIGDFTAPPIPTETHKKEAGGSYQDDTGPPGAKATLQEKAAELVDDEPLIEADLLRTPLGKLWFLVPLHVLLVLAFAAIYREHSEGRMPKGARESLPESSPRRGFARNIIECCCQRGDWSICLLSFMCPAVRWAATLDMVQTDHRVPTNRGHLSVRVIAAYNLGQREDGGQCEVSEAFVEARVGQEVFTTKTISNNMNPVWDSHTMQFHPDLSEEDKSVLYLQVFDYHRIHRSRPLGRLAVRIAADVPPGRDIRFREKLQDSLQGELSFDLCFVPEYDVQKGPLLNFWLGLCLMLLLQCLAPLTHGAAWFVAIVVGTYYRHRLRMIFDLNPAEPKNAMIDWLAWSFCHWCALAQEAFEVESMP